jgi:hypothetical protein
MNHLTRRFTSSGSLATNKIKSLATLANDLSLGFPSLFEGENRKQHRRFGSLISQHNGSFVRYNENLKTNSMASSPLSFSSIERFFSSNTTASETNNDSVDNDIQEEQTEKQVLSPTSSPVFTDNETGEQFGIILDTRKLPKLKPSVVRRRLDNCRTYVGKERSIRQSPWKLNRICQLAAGLTLEEALTQLKFCDLKNADLVAKVLKRTSNLADIRDGLQISQLEVKECFATKSLMLRRIKPMGRGR